MSLVVLLAAIAGVDGIVGTTRGRRPADPALPGWGSVAVAPADLSTALVGRDCGLLGARGDRWSRPGGARQVAQATRRAEGGLLSATVSRRASGQAAAGAEVPAGDADRGAALYVRYGCSQCHGRVAQGGAAGPRIGPKPPAFPAFVRTLRRPVQQMPPYSERAVSEAELADIYTFLRSLPAPPSRKDLPLLR